MDIDIQRLVNDFGGAAVLAASLSAACPDKPISPSAIYKWLKRGSIPGAYYERLTGLAERQGFVLAWDDYHAGATNRTTMAPIRIYDASLAQCQYVSGFAIDGRSKALIAQKLEKLGVDVIEVAHRLTAQADFSRLAEEVSTVASALERVQLAATMCFERSEPAWMSAFIQLLSELKPMPGRLGIVVSLDQMRQTGTRGQNRLLRWLERINTARAVAEVVLTGVSAYEPLLTHWAGACIGHGAATVTLSDDTGMIVPDEMGTLVRTMRMRTADAGRAVWALRCQNDLGLASANMLSALNAGVREVQVSIGGLGQRAGMTSLEEVVMSLLRHPRSFALNSRLDSRQIGPAARLIAMVTGQPVFAGKALLGAHAFELASAPAIHHPSLALTPDQVGWGQPETEIGPLSGRSAFKHKIETLGIRLDSEIHLSRAFFRFKELARRKRVIFDEDIYAMFLAFAPEDDNWPCRLVASKVVSETGELPFAAVIVHRGDKEVRAEASGSGAIDALFCALEKIVVSGAELVSYAVSAVTRGSDSQAEVTVRLQHNDCLYCGLASDTDTITASAEAYLAAANSILIAKRRKRTKTISNNQGVCHDIQSCA